MRIEAYQVDSRRYQAGCPHAVVQNLSVRVARRPHWHKVVSLSSDTTFAHFLGPAKPLLQQDASLSVVGQSY